MDTYQEFYEGEIRTLKLSIRDKNGQKFLPTAASASVMTYSNIPVSSTNSSASIVNNEIYKLIDKNTTDNPGTYKVAWTIKKDQNIYKHITELRVSKI